ncbi:hypothetical protein EC968_002224 [Mortierella alpina]|nr:hypothetical protein EC968_002224 [Mortierella alpina]
MDPPSKHNDSGIDDHHPLTENEYDDYISSWWKKSRKPATYSEDYVGVMGHRLEPLRSPSINKATSLAALAESSTTQVSQTLTAEYSSSLADVASSEYITLSPPSQRELAAEGVSSGSPSNTALPTPTDAEPLSAASPTEAPKVCATSVWAPSRHKRNSTEEHVAEVSGANTEPAKSESVDSIGKESGTVDSSSGASYDFNTARLLGTEGDTSAGSGSGCSMKPNIPRIVIPDGTSINLSTPPTTPPTTPRQNGHAIQQSWKSPWPHNFTHIKERLLSPTRYFRRGPGPLNSYPSQEAAQKLEQHQGEQSPTQHSARSPAQENDNHPIESIEPEPPGELSQPGQGMERAAAVPLPINTLDHEYLSQFGIMGLSVGYRPESTASSDKFTWTDYNRDTPGRLFSRARWKHLCCTRPGWITMLKHIITTSLGIIMIVAIALTALGKIKNRQQVSDTIPESLDGAILEAQIVVIKDFEGLQDDAKFSTSSDDAEGAEVAHMHQIKLQQAVKIPVWTQPIPPGCLHKECDAESFGKEYFAFMNPESFGIALPHNWPSLCNSCIEISRNQFVYQTRVRILGDLVSCSPSPVTPINDATTTTLAPHSAGPAPSAHRLISQNHASSTSLVAPTKNPTVASSTQGSHRRKVQHRHHRAPKPHVLGTAKSNAPLRHSHSGTKSKQHPQQHLMKHSRHDRHPHQPLSDELFVRQKPTPSKHRLHKRQGLQESEPDVGSLPYLIVDPATFGNLTIYDTQAALASMVHLRVQFRFVLCDS